MTIDMIGNEINDDENELKTKEEEKEEKEEKKAITRKNRINQNTKKMEEVFGKSKELVIKHINSERFKINIIDILKTKQSLNAKNAEREFNITKKRILEALNDANLFTIIFFEFFGGYDAINNQLIFNPLISNGYDPIFEFICIHELMHLVDLMFFKDNSDLYKLSRMTRETVLPKNIRQNTDKVDVNKTLSDYITEYSYPRLLTLRQKSKNEEYPTISDYFNERLTTIVGEDLYTKRMSVLFRGFDKNYFRSSYSHISLSQEIRADLMSFKILGLMPKDFIEIQKAQKRIDGGSNLTGLTKDKEFMSFVKKFGGKIKNGHIISDNSSSQKNPFHTIQQSSEYIQMTFLNRIISIINLDGDNLQKWQKTFEELATIDKTKSETNQIQEQINYTNGNNQILIS